MTREVMDPGLAAQPAGFREARRELEASVLPLATSVGDLGRESRRAPRT